MANEENLKKGKATQFKSGEEAAKRKKYMAKYKRKSESLEGLTEEDIELEKTKQWLDSCRHIDEEIDHERAVLLYSTMRIRQLETMKKVIELTKEEIKGGGMSLYDRRSKGKNERV